MVAFKASEHIQLFKRLDSYLEKHCHVYDSRMSYLNTFQGGDLTDKLFNVHYYANKRFNLSDLNLAHKVIQEIHQNKTLTYKIIDLKEIYLGMMLCVDKDGEVGFRDIAVGEGIKNHHFKTLKNKFNEEKSFVIIKNFDYPHWEVESYLEQDEDYDYFIHIQEKKLESEDEEKHLTPISRTVFVTKAHKDFVPKIKTQFNLTLEGVGEW